jgi:hypothetical protein
MKRTLAIVITLLLVVSFFAAPQLNSSGAVFAQSSSGNNPTDAPPAVAAFHWELSSDIAPEVSQLMALPRL